MDCEGGDESPGYLSSVAIARAATLRREQLPGPIRPVAHRRLHPAPFGGRDEQRRTVLRELGTPESDCPLMRVSVQKIPSARGARE
jgi:hypothetical protein